MGNITEKDFHELATTLTMLKISCVNIGDTLNKICDFLLESAKRDAETTKDKNGWIKINSKEDCPKNEEPVLIKCDLGEGAWWFEQYHVGSYRIGGYWCVEDRFDIENYLSAKVTHWMPIPKL